MNTIVNNAESVEDRRHVWTCDSCGKVNTGHFLTGQLRYLAMCICEKMQWVSRPQHHPSARAQ